MTAPPDLEQQLLFTSGSMRVLLGVAALAGLPFAFPELASLRLPLAAYLCFAALILILIHRRIGGSVRSMTSGVVDLAVLTWLVHELGSNDTVLLAIYIYAAVLNVLVSGPALGRLMAVLGAAFYGGVILLEQLTVIDNPSGASPGQAVTSWALVATLTLIATSIVARLTTRMRDHEAALRQANQQLADTNTALERANEQLEHLSQHDGLTELYNRRALTDRLDDEIRRVRRGRPVCFIMIDLDGFKRVNDRYGHVQGDALLRSLASVLRETVREVDLVGRYGGDELAVLLPDTTIEDAEIVASRLVERMREAGQQFSADARVTASVGVAAATEQDDADALIQRADEATYRAKREGGDRYRIGTAPEKT